MSIEVAVSRLQLPGLVDWTGTAIRAETWFISKGVLPLSKDLEVDAESWLQTVRHYRRQYYYDYVVSADAMRQRSLTLGRNRLRRIGTRQATQSGGGKYRAGLALAAIMGHVKVTGTQFA